METYHIALDPTAAGLYQKIAEAAGLPIEKVLADALYKLAGSLSIDAMLRRCEKSQTKNRSISQ